MNNEFKNVLAIFGLLMMISGIGAETAHNSTGLALILAERNSQEVSIFVSPEIVAKSAIVYDILGDKVLYSKNSEVTLPAASLTKLMTALTSEIFDSEEYTVKYMVNPNGEDELWKLSDIRDVMLVASANNAAASLASTLADGDMARFNRMMNTEAKRIGLKQSFFLNETGLDESESVSGGYTSARDVARLFSHLVRNYPSILNATRREQITRFSTSGDMLLVENTNHLVTELPSVLGSKTGLTDLAGGNLAMAFDIGPARPVVIVVLGSTGENRFTDVESLWNATVQYITGNKLL